MPSQPRDIALDRLGQIAMTVSDVERSTAFYRDTLGMPFLFAFPGLAFFALGSVRLMLSRPEDGAQPPSASPLYFVVDDLDAAHAALAERGVAFVDAPHVVHRDERIVLSMAFFHDPDGNLLALMHERPVT